ncbi:MAG: serine hydrolase [Crocinitomicaceae bacterium]|nr:serine hydrolase [Crocinitomicaceae bacterium]
MQHNLKRIRAILLLLMITTNSVVFSQEIDEAEPVGYDLIDQIYGVDSLVDHVLENREKYRLQFMLTDIVEQDSSLYLGNTYNFTAPNWYFYPASVVKFPVALLSLEKLKELDFSTKAKLKFERDFDCGNMTFVDESIKSSVSFKEMIRELIIVSNNTYYNSLYHFLSPKRINEELNNRGLAETNIYKDFTGCEMPLNMKTHGFDLEELEPMGAFHRYHQDGSQLELEEFASKYIYDSTKLLGSKHEYRRDIVDGPFDFNYNLEYSAQDIHSTSMRFFFPQFFAEKDCWDIREEDRQILLESMKSVPKDLGKKKYTDKKKYPDNLYKYTVLGDENPKYASVITYSKLGLSYGFVTETAYVHNPATNRHYVLTVNLYVNSNDTVNDGKYEYEELAKPFLARLGQLLLDL